MGVDAEDPAGGEPARLTPHQTDLQPEGERLIH